MTTMVTLQNLKDECFMGNRDRTCKTCPAHPSKGGDCCFGRLHEYNDSNPNGCQACLHEADCAPISHAKEQGPAQPYSVQQPQFHPGTSTPVTARAPAPVTPTSPPLPGYCHPNHTPNYSGYPYNNQSPYHGIAEAAPSLIHQYAAPERHPIQTEDMSKPQEFATCVSWGALEGSFEFALHWMRKYRPI